MPISLRLFQIPRASQSVSPSVPVRQSAQADLDLEACVCLVPYCIYLSVYLPIVLPRVPP